MKQMLKKAEIRSRRLNTIMEMVESQDENGNLVADSNPAKVEISSDISNTTSLTRRLYQHRSSRDATATYSPRERRIPCSHATPQTLSATSPNWRERDNVSITPAGVVRSSSELLTGSALKPGHAVSEVELFFPEFFTDGEMKHSSGTNIEPVHVHKDEPNRNSQHESEDPLVQSWLDLFGSQFYR